MNLLAIGASEDSGETAEPFADVYDPPVNAMEEGLNQGDGQAFAAFAMDPLLRRPDVFVRDEQAAYRAQRPLLGWLAWAASGGQAAFVAPALYLLTVVSVAVLVATTAHTAALDRTTWWHALLLIAAPGCLVVLDWAGPEAAAAAMILAALHADRSDRRWVAIGILAAAALTKETSLLAVVAIAAHGLLARGRPLRQAAATVLVPASVFVCWVFVVRARFGHWPTEASEGRLDPPFVGMFHAVPLWNAADWATAVATAAVVVAAVVKGTGPHRAVVIAFAIGGTLLGNEVWQRFEGFGRILLPLFAAAAVALLSRRGTDDATAVQLEA